MILAVDPTIIAAIAAAVVAIITTIGTAAVKIIDAVNKRADTASVERQAIAKGEPVPEAPVRPKDL